MEDDKRQNRHDRRRDKRREMDGNGNEYFKGMTVAQIKQLFDDIGNINTRLDTIETKVDSLNMWKSKVIGASGVVGMIGGLITKFLFDK